MPASSYPIVLTSLDSARCVVVGGGAVAERKAAGLIEAGARPRVVSPTLTAMLAGWRAVGLIDHLERAYRPGDLKGAALVIAATSDPAVNLEVAAEGRERGILVNVASDPAAGTFHTVATVRRGDLLLTISTGGQSPALAARLRAELAERLGPEYAAILQGMARLRAALSPQARRRLEDWLCSEEALEMLRGGALVDAVVNEALADAATDAEEER